MQLSILGSRLLFRSRARIFTTFGTHPKTTVSAAAFAGLAGAALVSWFMKPSLQVDQRPAPREDDEVLREQPHAQEMRVDSVRGRALLSA